MAEAEFDLRALCEKGRVTPRTVHFYVQQGLLPPAGSPGPGARYGEGHVSRLRLIRLLQKQHLPLAEIARRMKGLSDAQVNELIAETKQRRPVTGGSALQYIREVLAQPPAPSASALKRRSHHGLFSTPPSADPAEGTPLPTVSRSQWDRYELTDGIELQVQRPLSRMQQKQLDRLISAARDIFQEESS